jgi:hypothetical protein
MIGVDFVVMVLVIEDVAIPKVLEDKIAYKLGTSCLL